MLIDFHAHLYDEPGYGEALAETARNLGLERLCIAGGEERYGLAHGGALRPRRLRRAVRLGPAGAI